MLPILRWTSIDTSDVCWIQVNKYVIFNSYDYYMTESWVLILFLMLFYSIVENIFSTLSDYFPLFTSIYVCMVAITIIYIYIYIYIYIGLVWFNGISTFVGYLMPKPFP